jgi:P27 family predicted phage terminase small subunit
MPRTVRKDANLKPGKPPKPENLSPAASEKWDKLIGQLERSQILVSEAHAPLLSLAATLAADISDMWEVVRKEGCMYTNAKTGAIMQHPASKRLDALRRDYLKAIITLGLRAQAAPPPKEGPTLMEILNGD